MAIDHSLVRKYRNLANEARELRRKQTPEEAFFWELVRDRRLGGFKFRRQHPISCFIPDFICLERNLIVEIDGFQHRTPEGLVSDHLRDQELSRMGLKVLRFSNESIKTGLDFVLKTVLLELLATPCPSPSEAWRGTVQGRPAGTADGQGEEVPTNEGPFH